MFYYIKEETYFISDKPLENMEQVSWEQLFKSDVPVYYMNYHLSKQARLMARLTHPDMLNMAEETTALLAMPKEALDVDPNLVDLMKRERLISLNAQYENWLEWALRKQKPKWRVHLLGLGDVGGTLATGLKLLGADCIEALGIYDRDDQRLNRWERELNQIKYPFDLDKDFRVEPITYDDLFDCDMFVFCASRFIPQVGSQVKDVRMAQFESNAEIIKEYAQLARAKNFKGIFAVVSDPVDLLCKCVYLESNRNEEGRLDWLGLPADRVRGYGLGVMNARACYYAAQQDETKHYLREGRAFGPHGKDLIIADSIDGYDQERSMYLTERTISANMEVRDAGFKPFIAPALSSGAISLLATIRGEWHYSATYLGDVYMGAKNRFKNEVTELERIAMPEQLRKRIDQTYQTLKAIL